MKPKSLKSILFLKEQQELSAMFEPKKVAHYFLGGASELTKTNPASSAKGKNKEGQNLLR